MTDVSRTKILRCGSGMGCRLKSFRGVGDRLAQVAGKGKASPGHPDPAGASCPSRPHPRPLSTSGEGRKTYPCRYPFFPDRGPPPSTKWRGTEGEASEGRTLQPDRSL